MQDDKLNSTRVSLDSGSAVVTITRILPPDRVEIDVSGSLVELTHPGVYRFDAKPGLRVYHGVAQAQRGRRPANARQGRPIGLTREFADNQVQPAGCRCVGPLGGGAGGAAGFPGAALAAAPHKGRVRRMAAPAARSGRPVRDGIVALQVTASSERLSGRSGDTRSTRDSRHACYEQGAIQPRALLGLDYPVGSTSQALPPSM